MQLLIQDTEEKMMFRKERLPKSSKKEAAERNIKKNMTR